jgi:hypothetical protein
MKEKDETSIGIWGFIRDVSERKKAAYELENKMKQLEKYKNITIGRELRIIELKKQVKELEEKLNKAEKT